MDIKGRTAVVTGGARGIGSAICDTLARDGWNIAVWNLHLDTAKQRAADLSAEHGVTCHASEVDISSPQAVSAAVADVEAELGPIDALVNNAGIDMVKPFMDLEPDEWERIISVNLKGTIACCRAVLEGMIQRGRGRIVSISSDAGRVGSSCEAVYSATKGGIIAFTKALAREMARHNITINCVSPGPTETALLDQVAQFSQRLYSGLARAIPLGRTAQPADIAPAVAFLLSDGADYITGQTLSVSGGLTMS